MKITEKSYRWAAQSLFIAVGTILLAVAVSMLYFYWPSYPGLTATIWFFILLLIGSALIFYRRKLIVSDLWVIVQSTYFGCFLKQKKYSIKEFLNISVTKQAYPPGQLYSDSSSSADGCFVRLVPRQGRKELDVSDFILGGGVSAKGVKTTIEFAKGLAELTGLRVEYSQSARMQKR